MVNDYLNQGIITLFRKRIGLADVSSKNIVCGSICRLLGLSFILYSDSVRSYSRRDLQCYRGF